MIRISDTLVGKRQFILAREAVEAQGWTSEKLSSGYILSWENHLKVLVSADKIVCLIGHCWSVVEEGYDVSRALTMSRDAILNEEKTWSGRYLLIIGDEIYLDASGTLGVFYDGEIISSSLSLIFKIKGLDVVYPKIKHGIALDFVPGEYTECPGVKRLLPSLVLNYTTGMTYSRELLPDRDFPQLSEAERTELLSKYLVIGLRNMHREFPESKLMLALTGGRDSRTTLVGLALSGLSYETFTLEHGDIDSDDVNLPPVLAKRLGVRHRYIRRDKKAFSREKYDEYLEFGAGLDVDEDLLFYAYGQYSRLVEDSRPIVILRSSIYPNVIYSWSNFLSEGEPFTAENLRKISHTLRFKDEYYNSLSEWFKSTEVYGRNLWIDISNLFNWENRCGCWTSSIEHSFDIYDDITSVQVGNSRVCVSLMMGYSADDRRERRTQEGIVSTICPRIGDVGYCKKPFADNAGKIQKIVAKLGRVPSGIRRRLMTRLWLIKNYGITAFVKR